MSDEQHVPVGLRSRAEAALASGRRPRQEYAELEDRDRLLRELSVYQLEVELQNEDLRATQRALQEEERQLRAILDAAIEGIVTFDRTGAIAICNRAAEELFAIPLQGRNIVSLMAPEDEASLRRWLAAYGTGDGQAPARRELTGIRGDGLRFPIEMGLGLAHAGDARVTAVIRDLSERTQLQERFLQAQKMEAVGRLASGVAHDFNNLLMGISGSADVALGYLAPEHPARGLIGEIRREAVGGAGIVRQLLAFGRRPVGEGDRCELDPVLARSEGMVARLLGEDVVVQMRLRASGAAVALPPSQVQQILMNLVANARDAMSEGGVLSVDTEALEPEPGGAAWVHLTISDTGDGMDAPTRELIFEPFFTTKGTAQGTGLGLWTVFSLVRQAGGHIDVDSEPGQGTAFRVLLPAAAPLEEPAPAAGEVPVGRGEAILVVEDEPLVRRAICHYLRQGGYRVLDACTCAGARSRLGGEAAIDLILSDVVLPDGYGTELAPGADGPPILLMSAHPAEMLERAGRLPPGVTTLQKPCARDLLMHRVRQALDASLGRAPAPAPARPTTVLVVEDHDATRCAIVQLLGGEGYRVIGARNGAEALAAAGAAPSIDMLVTDVRLPDLAGDSIAERVRGRYPDLPVLFVSGLEPGDERVARATARKGTRFLQKPVELERLIDIVRLALVASPEGTRP